MIIDIHNHADCYGMNVEKFIANMDDNNIDIAFLLSCEGPLYDYAPNLKHILSPFTDNPIPFERCVAYKERMPDRFQLGFCPDPRRPDAINRLKSAIGLFDIRDCGEFKLRMMFDNPDALRMFRYCGEVRLPVLVHIDYELTEHKDGYPWPDYWYGGGIEALERAMILCPDTIFIGHAPGFWAHISGDGKYLTDAYPTGIVIPGGKVPEMLDKYPNLYCDISAGSGYTALSRDIEYAKSFLLKYQDKILYGRDGFDTRHKEVLESLYLPRNVMDKIYYKNAVTLMRLEYV